MNNLVFFFFFQLNSDTQIVYLSSAEKKKRNNIGIKNQLVSAETSCSLGRKIVYLRSAENAGFWVQSSLHLAIMDEDAVKEKGFEHKFISCN